ncbi:S1 family peptidase [Jidongwangia harbinensis]|uniref:S1 family peptidase n=1 Tax=Jidongwangia harbinensis TaxID=2878561 RepID=UPI001CDA3653|nr:S1 family peptidase [Jidongwangia harbinensis]MCA2211285.1 S1 family peptidase [Jidongwangia harbinensis]
MDQREGKLTFRTSRPDVATRALGAAAAEARIVPSRHTAAELAAARTAVAKRLPAGPGAGVGVWADPATETIKVTYRGTDDGVEARVRRSAGTVADAGVPVTVDASGPSPKADQRSCQLLNCGPTVRGGMRMHIRRDPDHQQNGRRGSCTVGFTVRGSDGWAYLLAAGHRVEGPGPKRQYAYHAGLPLAWEKAAPGYDEHDQNAPPDAAYFMNEPGGTFHDYALMPFQTDGMNWSGYWLNGRGGNNLVGASCTTPSSRPCSGDTYAISGVRTREQIVPGTVACATGTGTIYPDSAGYQWGSRCGEIKAKNMEDYFLQGNSGHGVKVDICSRKGDSGGPLFSQLDSKAYGVLSGGPPRSEPCDPAHPQEYSVYTSLSHDLQEAARRTNKSYNVITTANG